MVWSSPIACRARALFRASLLIVLGACSARSDLWVDGDGADGGGAGDTTTSGTGAGGPANPVCKPGDPVTTLATDLVWPYGVATDATHLYFVTYDDVEGGVFRVPKAGGARETLADGLSFPNQLQLRDGFVVFAESGRDRIASVSKSGGNVFTLYAGQDGPSDLALDGDQLFWSNYFGNQIVHADSRQSSSVIDTPSAPFRLALSQQRVYFTALGPDVGWVGRDGLTSGAIPAEQPRDVAITAEGEVFWTDANRGLWRSGPDGEGPSTFGVFPNDPAYVGFYDGLALDEDYVFVANGAGSVLRFSRQGDPPSVVATGQNSPATLTVDNSCVYWGNTGLSGGPGSIMRAPKHAAP